MAIGTRERLKRLELRIAGLEWRLAGLAEEAPSPKPVPGALPETLPGAEAPEGNAGRRHAASATA